MSETFLYSVDLNISFETFRDLRVSGLTPWRQSSRHDAAEPARLWCTQNITRRWTASVTPEPMVDSYGYSFRFESQEDAALFKLFWSEGV